MTELNIHQRLAKITEDAQKIPKRGRNDFSKYDYIMAVDVINHISELCLQNGVRVTISETEFARALHGKNFHTSIKCDATFINTDDPADVHHVFYWAVAADTLDKDIYKAKTNGLKYLFIQEFKLITDDVKDIETKDGGDGADNLERITESQIVNLREIAESKNFPWEPTLNRLANKIFGIKKIEELPASQFEKAQKFLNEQKSATQT